MLKKVLCLMLSLSLLVMPLVGQAESFSSSAKGFGGDVTVTLDVDGDKLSDVRIEGTEETPAVGGAAMEKLAEKMLSSNTVAVEAVSGATFTSNAVLAAAEAALTASGATLTPV